VEGGSDAEAAGESNTIADGDRDDGGESNEPDARRTNTRYLTSQRQETALCTLMVERAEPCREATDYVRFGLELAFACSAFRSSSSSRNRSRLIDQQDLPTSPVNVPHSAGSWPLLGSFACRLCSETVNPLADQMHCCPTTGPNASFTRTNRGAGVEAYHVHGEWLHNCELMAEERRRVEALDDDLKKLIQDWSTQAYVEFSRLGQEGYSRHLSTDNLIDDRNLYLDLYQDG